MALGDREVERKTLHQSAEGKGPCPTGVPLSGQQALRAPRSKYGCSQALPPPGLTSTVDVQSVQNKAFCLNISVPQCRTCREGVGGTVGLQCGENLYRSTCQQAHSHLSWQRESTLGPRVRSRPL